MTDAISAGICFLRNEWQIQCGGGSIDSDLHIDHDQYEHLIRPMLDSLEMPPQGPTYPPELVKRMAKLMRSMARQVRKRPFGHVTLRSQDYEEAKSIAAAIRASGGEGKDAGG